MMFFMGINNLRHDYERSASGLSAGAFYDITASTTG